MASKELVRRARLAAAASATAGKLNREWRAQFAKEYGHEDVSDALVEVIDYSFGNLSMLTAEFIDRHSAPDKS